MFRKFLKISYEGRRPVSFIKKRQEACLNTMPTEILTIIFSYLSPKTLLIIRELGVERFKEISLAMTVVDFSQINTVRKEVMSSFFTGHRMEYIKNINFDNVFFINPTILQNYIIQCVHLKVLSVIECGISYSNMICILKHCSQLQELYWSVSIIKFVKTCGDVYNNIKKLYLHIKLLSKVEFVVINKLLEICPNAHDVCLNISPCFSKTLPHDIIRTGPTGRIYFKNRNHPVKVVSINDISQFPNAARFLMQKLSHFSQKNVEDVFETGEDLSYFISNFSSFLQFITDKNDIAKLSSIPDASIHSLIVIMTDNKGNLLDHIEKLKKITGSKLKHLSFCNTVDPSTLKRDCMFWETSSCALFCDILSPIVCNAGNLSILNLSEMHFDQPFPLPALYCLKGLKVLSLSSCCLKFPSSTFENKVYYVQIKEFEGLVTSCTNVENFSIAFCLKCAYGPSDPALHAIGNWKKLKSVILIGIKQLRVCTFLQHVARNCPDFENLELTDIGEPTLCHYLSNVIHIIRNCRKLRFLRINQPMLYPSHPHFWKSIELAKNLQGICLTTKSDAVVDNRMVINALRKLPNLHLFHLSACRMSLNLSPQIKLFLTFRGVQTSDIRVYPTIAALYKKCSYAHFPTF